MDAESILRFVRSHGMVARIVTDDAGTEAVEIEIPFVNVRTGAEGTDIERVSTYTEARIALGY